MGEIVFKTINVGTVSAGSTSEGTWTPERDYIIKKIVAVEKSDQSLSNVTVTFWIDEVPFTKELIPLGILQETPSLVIDIDKELGKGSVFKYSITNNYSADREIFLVLVLEKG